MSAPRPPIDAGPRRRMRSPTDLASLLLASGALEPPPPRPGPLRRLWLWLIRRG